MNLQLSDEQLMFAETAARMVSGRYDFDHRRKIIRSGALCDSGFWAELAELGAFHLFVEEEKGGLGGSLLDCGLLAEVLGEYLVAEPVVALGMIPARLFGALGSDDLLAGQLDGSLRTLVVDARDRVPGNPTGVGLQLSMIEGAPGATHIAVLCADCSLWSVPLVEPWARVAPLRMLDGRLAGDITISSAAEFTLVAAGAGAAFDRVQAEASIAEQWFQVGSTRSALQATTTYMKERRQFGRVLADFQAVQLRVAEMAVACEEAEAAAILSAVAFDGAADEDARRRAWAGGKLQVARAARTVAEGAVQLHGGIGVSEELPIAAHYRQMVAFAARRGTVQQACRIMADATLDNGLYAQSAVLGAVS